MFSDFEVAVLKDFAAHHRLPVPGNLGVGVLTMAIIAGYLNRKNDPPPGYKNIWEGYFRLIGMVEGYQLLLIRSDQSYIHHKLSPD